MAAAQDPPVFRLVIVVVVVILNRPFVVLTPQDAACQNRCSIHPDR
jgi:hypothetical protein